MDGQRSPSQEGAADRPAGDDRFDERRRTLLARLGKAAGYAAPVTVAMLSMKASACSMTC